MVSLNKIEHTQIEDKFSKLCDKHSNDRNSCAKRKVVPVLN
jgi:hypothetical protein